MMTPYYIPIMAINIPAKYYLNWLRFRIQALKWKWPITPLDPIQGESLSQFVSGVTMNLHANFGDPTDRGLKVLAV